MNKIIINADDCGKSVDVNEAINQAIEKGLITSTTVMANMDDLEGALALYRKWNGKISFGVHLNITEGHPLVPSPILLDTKFCIPKSDGMVFNKLHFLYRYPSKDLKIAVYLELKAQIERILDCGIKISHIDSHRHMHLGPFLLPIVCRVAKEYGIIKIRHSRNRLGYSLRDFKERGLNLYRKTVMNDMISTDVFCAVSEYSTIMKKDDKTYELMCHPGHPNPKYVNEMLFLEDIISHNLRNCRLITYNDL